MHARIARVVAWISLFAAAIALVIGHLGTHEFHWTYNQISTYAARAPNAAWMTAGMLFSALASVCLGLCVSWRRAREPSLLSVLAAMGFGVAAAGLVLLACFKETAMNVPRLRQLGFDAVRQQTFHDAGLLLFFCGATFDMATSGLIVTLEDRDYRSRLQGTMIGATGVAAGFLMTNAWPDYLGIADASIGIRQRAALFCLWIGAALLLASLRRDRGDTSP